MLRLWEGLGVGLDAAGGKVAEAVTGWAASFSDRASDVAGVGKSDDGPSVDACDSVCSPLSSNSSALSLAGSCKSASAGGWSRRRRRRRGILCGNSSFAQEYHGSFQLVSVLLSYDTEGSYILSGRTATSMEVVIVRRLEPGPVQWVVSEVVLVLGVEMVRTRAV